MVNVAGGFKISASSLCYSRMERPTAWASLKLQTVRPIYTSVKFPCLLNSANRKDDNCIWKNKLSFPSLLVNYPGSIAFGYYLARNIVGLFHKTINSSCYCNISIKENLFANTVSILWLQKALCLIILRSCTQFAVLVYKCIENIAIRRLYM